MLSAIVKKVLINGLVIEVDGNMGFVPRRELSWNNARLDPKSHYKFGQEISVIPLGESDDGEKLYSHKLVEYDPWANKIDKYQKALNDNCFPVVRGVVRHVSPKCIYVILEDNNDAIIFPSSIPYNQEQSGTLSLNELFSVGDHVEARIKEIGIDYRNFILDIAGYAGQLAIDRKKLESSTSWKTTLGEVLPQLSELGLFEPTKDRKQSANFSTLHILVIEDDRDDREKLSDILKRYSCNVVCPKSKSELDSKLSEPHCFDLAFVDLRLDNWQKGLRGHQFINKIKLQSPGVRILVTTRDNPEGAKTVFSGVELSEIIQKPLKSHFIEHFLSEAAKGATSSSLEAMRRMDLNARYKRDLISMDQKLEEGLDILLRILCKKGEGQLRAVVLRMDLITEEIQHVSSYGFEEIPWSDHKSTLLYTPIENVIHWDEPLVNFEMPESWKKHFPNEIQFISFAGIPIQTFGETNHGLFLFGSSSTSISEEIYHLAHESALAMARLLERAMTDEILFRDALFASMGRLYMVMGHEIRDAVTGIQDLPLKLSKYIETIGSKDIDPNEKNQILKNMGKIVNSISMAGNRIMDLFNFYADLSRNDITLQKIHLKRFIDKIVEEMKDGHCSRKIIFQITIDDPESLIIIGSLIKLRQVLRNLILNACQQMEDSGSPCPYVGLRAFIDKSDLRLPVKIMISDAGPGIHTKDWEKIFEPWHSTRKKGAGLGLYICRLLVRAMGGKIQVYESFRFIGTTFRIELPQEMMSEQSKQL